MESHHSNLVQCQTNTLRIRLIHAMLIAFNENTKYLAYYFAMRKICIQFHVRFKFEFFCDVLRNAFGTVAQCRK